MKIRVLRLSHRIDRDKRISTHVALVARAMGCSEIVYSGEKDRSLEESTKKIVKNWGGNFNINYVSKWKSAIDKWKRNSLVVHLTVYGMPLIEKMKEIRTKRHNLVLIIGGEKVPYEVYKLVDYNISVTNQPHSEVAALAIFLHEYFEGKEFGKTFKNAKLKIIPQEKGKKVVKSN